VLAAQIQLQWSAVTEIVRILSDHEIFLLLFLLLLLLLLLFVVVVVYIVCVCSLMRFVLSAGFITGRCAVQIAP
jgi:hypothetical protein